MPVILEITAPCPVLEIRVFQHASRQVTSNFLTVISVIVEIGESPLRKISVIHGGGRGYLTGTLGLTRLRHISN